MARLTRVYVALPSTQMRELRREADRLGTSVSGYVRQLVLAQLRKRKEAEERAAG